RPRRLGAARARAEDRRRCAGDPASFPAGVRDGGTGGGRGRATSPADLRHRGRGPDGRGAGGRDGGGRAAGHAAGAPVERHDDGAAPPGRRRGPGAPRLPAIALGQGAAAARALRRGGPDRGAGHRGRGRRRLDRRRADRGGERLLGRRRRRVASGRAAGRGGRPRRAGQGRAGPVGAGPPGGLRGRRPCGGGAGREAGPGRRACGDADGPARRAGDPGGPGGTTAAARPIVARLPLSKYRNGGRAAAVAEIAGLKLSGLVAWLVWVFVHILYLIGFRNRVVVMVQWAWAYLMYQRGVRLITGDRTVQLREPRVVPGLRRQAG